VTTIYCYSTITSKFLLVASLLASSFVPKLFSIVSLRSSQLSFKPKFSTNNNKLRRHNSSESASSATSSRSSNFQIRVNKHIEEKEVSRRNGNACTRKYTRTTFNNPPPLHKTPPFFRR